MFPTKLTSPRLVASTTLRQSAIRPESSRPADACSMAATRTSRSPDERSGRRRRKERRHEQESRATDRLLPRPLQFLGRLSATRAMHGTPKIDRFVDEWEARIVPLRGGRGEGVWCAAEVNRARNLRNGRGSGDSGEDNEWQFSGDSPTDDEVNRASLGSLRACFYICIRPSVQSVLCPCLIRAESSRASPASVQGLIISARRHLQRRGET